MRLRITFILLQIISISLTTQGQSKDILAKSAMLNAESSYENGNYRECIDFLKEVELNLGKTNSRIQYVKVKSLIALGTQNGYDKDFLVKADQELKEFFKVTPENSYVPEKYDEMVLELTRLKRIIAEVEIKTREAESLSKKRDEINKQDKEDYQFAKSNNSKYYYKDYLEKHPNGQYVEEAREKLSVKIGKQVWMIDNLDVDHYLNEDEIPKVYDAKEWSGLETGACCTYLNNSQNGSYYGRLYNWYAVNDPRGLCPTGWHIPDYNDWMELSSYLSGIRSGWEVMHSESEGGFASQPGGARMGNGLFVNIYNKCYWWSASSETMYIRENHPRSTGNIINGKDFRKYLDNNCGFSVRCIKNN